MFSLGGSGRPAFNFKGSSKKNPDWAPRPRCFSGSGFFRAVTKKQKRSTKTAVYDKPSSSRYTHTGMPRRSPLTYVQQILIQAHISFIFGVVAVTIYLIVLHRGLPTPFTYIYDASAATTDITEVLVCCSRVRSAATPHIRNSIAIDRSIAHSHAHTHCNCPTEQVTCHECVCVCVCYRYLGGIVLAQIRRNRILYPQRNVSPAALAPPHNTPSR